jgi:hypothetical protein
LNTKEEFTPGEWEHAAKPSSTSGRCTECLRSGNWTCKNCKKKKPKMEFAMWTDAHPTSRPNATTRCDSCMALLEEQRRHKEEIRKSNMAQVVVLDSRRIEEAMTKCNAEQVMEKNDAKNTGGANVCMCGSRLCRTACPQTGYRFRQVNEIHGRKSHIGMQGLY